MSQTTPDTKLMFININDKVSPAVLACLINRNVSLVYQYIQLGRFPDIKNGTYSYIECIDHLVSALLKAKEGKTRARTFSSSTSEGGEDDSMHPLMAAKLQQNIKTEIAREADLWQKIAIKRGEYVAFGDKLELVEGFLLSIRDTLLHLSNNYPDIQAPIDEAMQELYELGKVLVEEADVDADKYIDTMLAKELDL